MGGYNPKNERISYFLSHVSKLIDKGIVNYENMILLGDLNVSSAEHSMKDFAKCTNFIT